MKELTLQELRNIQFELLKHFKEFCEHNGIRYFICNGTLLGAVKYHRYIPWDDDIDVFLPRLDYDRLLEAFAEKNDNASYEIMSFGRTENYYYPFAKLIDTRTKLIEKNVCDINLGVNIDIFPIDNIGNTPKEVSRNFAKMKKLRKKLNWARLNDYTSSSIVKKLAKIIISSGYKLVGAKRYCEKIIALGKANKNDTEYIGNYIWGFYGTGEALPKKCFSSTVDVVFEGITFPAPVGYHEYLQGLYGDYSKEPPPEKQKTHHSFKAYRK